METHLVQGSASWLEMRKSKITASDTAIINGTNRWKTEYILWLEKRSVKEGDKPNAAMLHGKRTEMPAREAYIKKTETYVLPCVSFSKEWEYAMASLDGINEEGDVIVEIKCPFSSKLYDNALDLKIPAYYNDQMQWQLLVTNANRCDYFVYLNHLEHMLIKVYPDVEYQEELLAKAKAFMWLIKANKRPELLDSDIKFIKKLVKKSEPTDWDKFEVDYGLSKSDVDKYMEKS